MNQLECNRFLNTFKALEPRTKVYVRDLEGQKVVKAICNYIGSGSRSSNDIVRWIQCGYSDRGLYIRRLIDMNVGILFEEFEQDGKKHYRLIKGD